jgi:parallel beta-helix repeat protein
VGFCSPLAVLLLLGGSFAFHPAHAAESYDNCSGFIDTLPAAISTQGTWCLRHDLSTNLTSGNAIGIAANNVTLDCNDFKLGGLAAGSSSQAVGIHAEGRQNVAIRHCNIRGFYEGMYLDSGNGTLVEDNLLDQNLAYGIDIEFDPYSLVRRNRVYDTGGAGGVEVVHGIYASGDVVDNIVDGVSTAGGTGYVTGIEVKGAGTRISSNRVGGLASTDGGHTYGIRTVYATNLTIDGNRIVAQAPDTDGIGLSTASSSFCGGNTVANFVAAIVIDPCTDVGGNDRL